MKILDEYVTAEDAANLINRKVSLIRTLCRAGRLNGAEKIGTNWLIPREAILNYRPAKRGPKNRAVRRANDMALLHAALATAENRDADNAV